jgi:H+/Cl- antiporter ClcA
MPQYESSGQHLVWSLVAGPAIGLAAVVFSKAIHWSHSTKPDGWRLIVAPTLVFALLGLAAIPFPQLLGNGKDIVQQALVGELTVGLLLVLPVLKLAATAGCLASGTPGGLLTPTFACGSVLGGLLGWIWSQVAFGPSAPLGSYAAIGGAAFLAATTQGPLASIVLVLEMTRTTLPLMVPMILAAVGAAWTARRLGAKSIYAD